jgi:membrane-associated protease RseP (regulator of RpoE activity)
MAPSEVPKLHPGADDNASGTAAVLELARVLASGPKPKRGVLFVAFTGEEIGLLGSSHLAANLPYARENCAAMINMDMVGRMKDNKFFVGGAATGSTFKAIVHEVAKADAGLKMEVSDSLAIGGSDHASFTAKQIPALFIFSGLHGDYHRPSDTWDKIDPGPYARLIRFVAGVAQELANAPARPVYQKLEAAPVGTVGSVGTGASSSYGPYFGSVPDFGASEGGVKFADVRTGSPADLAGLRGGDLLVEFDGKPVSNLEDYTYLLRSKKPGDVVRVKVRRAGQEVTAEVKLAERR